MVMVMVMVMVMRMIMQRGEGQAVLLAELFVPARGVAIAIARAVLQPAANAFDMMVMAFLHRPDIGLETEHCLAVLAQRAVHAVLADGHFAQPVDEGIDDQADGR